MSLFSIAAQKADAPLIVLVCELSASRGSLIDTINPSYRLSWSTLSRSPFVVGAITLIAKVRVVKKDSEKREKIMPRNISSFTASLLSFLFRFPVGRMKICCVKKRKRVCARFDMFFQLRNEATCNAVRSIIYHNVLSYENED